MRLFTRWNLLAFGILLISLTVASHAEAPQADSEFLQSVAQASAVQPVLQTLLAPESACQASEDNSNLKLFALTPPLGARLVGCPVSCKRPCADECLQMGRGCKPDCTLSNCECYCNCF